MHQIELNVKGSHTNVVTHNYTQFDLKAIIDNKWSTGHISTKTLVYNEITYRRIPDHNKLPKKAKAYFWKLRKSFEETNADPKRLYEHWQV